MESHEHHFPPESVVCLTGRASKSSYFQWNCWTALMWTLMNRKSRDVYFHPCIYQLLFSLKSYLEERSSCLCNYSYFRRTGKQVPFTKNRDSNFWKGWTNVIMEAFHVPLYAWKIVSIYVQSVVTLAESLSAYGVNVECWKIRFDFL